MNTPEPSPLSVENSTFEYAPRHPNEPAASLVVLAVASTRNTSSITGTAPVGTRGDPGI